MINKFKDFLKKLSRKRNSDSNDQEDFLDEGNLPENYDELSEGEGTGDIPLPVETKSSWKDKFKITLPSFRKNKTDSEGDSTRDIPIPSEETLDQPKSTWRDKFSFGKKKEETTGSYSQGDATGEIPLPENNSEPKPSWREKLSFGKKKETQDEATGETALPVAVSEKASFKDRFSQSVSGFRTKFGSMNLKDWKLPEGMRSKKGESAISLSPSLSKSIEKFLSRDARETIHQVSLVVLICTITYTLGKVTALFLKGAPATDSAKDFTVSLDLENDFNPGTLGQVRSINIFRTNTGLGGKKKVADTKCEEAQQASNLPIKLVNTVVLQDTVKSLASVQIRGDRQLQEVREGEQISNLAKIFKITRLEILVKNLESGVCESITSDKARDTRSSPISVMSPSQSKEFKANKKMAGIENQGNKFIISKALLDDKMKEIANILTQARAIKIQNPDGTLAFKMTEMDPNGIFPYLGLQDQDIITSINGKPIYDLNEVMGLFAKIKNLDKLQLGVKREGSDSVLDYNIKK